MATGPEHYREAEKLLGYAQALPAEERGSSEETSFLAEAQVHATLALAAATAQAAQIYGDRDSGMCIEDVEEWDAVCGANGDTKTDDGPRRRHRITPEHLRLVANVYRAAGAQGRPPTQAVADRFGVAHSTAAKWVAHARRQGLIPSTTKGRTS